MFCRGERDADMRTILAMLSIRQTLYHKPYTLTSRDRSLIAMLSICHGWSEYMLQQK